MMEWFLGVFDVVLGAGEELLPRLEAARRRAVPTKHKQFKAFISIH